MDHGQSRRVRFWGSDGPRALGLAGGIAAFILVGTVPTVAAAQQPATVATALVLEGVTVVDVEQGKLLPARRVVIVGNRIQAIGPTGRSGIPKGAQVVDARGKYLIPGLWDMHVHTWAYPSHLLLLAYGVTGIRDAWSSVPLDTMRQWRREILAGARVGPPRQLLSAVAINSRSECVRKSNGWTGHTCVSSVDSADARRLVDSLKAAGVDLLKMYDVSKQMYAVIGAEAQRVGLRFGGHIGRLSPVEASDIGAAIIDHNDEASGGLGGWCLHYRGRSTVEGCRPIAERLRRNGTWWVPTVLNVYGPAAQSVIDRTKESIAQFWKSDTVLRMSLGPGMKRVPDDSLNTMDIAHRVGVPILLGTDANLGSSYVWSNPGFSVHTVLGVYVAEGLTPLEALRTATLNPAKFLRATDSLGTVAPGKLADLVLLDADPLADIANTTMIRAVVANGRYFDRVALDRLLAEVQAKAPKP